MATSDAHISIGAITLIVNNLAIVSDFYRQKIGLEVISSDATSSSLGQGDTPLIKLIEDKNARRYPNEAGLFHTAFLLPNRSSLAEWYAFSQDNKFPLEGVADHGVSEAIYLSDPEGNGVEMYADRDRSNWNIDKDGGLKIETKPLNTRSLLKDARSQWSGTPKGTVVGHVHLQIGELQQADAFYVKELGFTRTVSMESASFYGAGGYHHHLAGNIWNSYGSGRRSSNSTGLLEVELLVSDENHSLQSVEDPWGTKFNFTSNS